MIRAASTKRSKISHSNIFSPIVGYVIEEARRALAFQCAGEADWPAYSEMEEIVKKSSKRLGFELSALEIDAVINHLQEENASFGILQTLVDDREVTDIVVSDFSKITVQQGRRNYRTSLSFPNQDAFEKYVERLLARAGTQCTTKQPIADGMLGESVRVNVIHRALCSGGPYLTLRINRFSSVDENDLANAGMASPEMLRYLTKLVRENKSILIMGEVGTGKTTLARALASAISIEESILVIEDTPEIKLEHPHVRYITTRQENQEGIGRVTPAHCIRAGMRMSMNRIIFGEIRDAEAAEAFVDVCASGHSGLSTIHARNIADGITRLELFLSRAQPGIDRTVLSAQISSAVSVIVSVKMCPITGVRRINEVKEVGPVADGVLRLREVFRYVHEVGALGWRVVTKSSLFRDTIESGAAPIDLAKFPDILRCSNSKLKHEGFNLLQGGD